MAIFKTNKEKLQDKQEKFQGQLSEVARKIQRLNVALDNAEVEQLVDPSKANNSRVDKLQAGKVKFEAEQVKLSQELVEVTQELSQIQAKEQEVEIKKAQNTFEERAFTYYKRRMFEKQIQKIADSVYNGTSTQPQAQELRDIAGLAYGSEFSQLSHKHLIDAHEEADSKARAKAEKEVAELVSQIEKVLGFSNN